MSKEKEKKVFQLIGLCLVTLIVLVVMVVMVLSGYLAEDIIAFGRRNHGTRELSEDPSGYWVNVLVWAGFLIFFVGISARAIVCKIREIQDS